MKRELTGAALTAQQIRKELKNTFPEIKFSVTSSTYSMGDSVTISYTDGAIDDLVERILKKYQNGSFDSMREYYDYREIDKSLNCPGAKYISVSRTISDERGKELADHCEKQYGMIPEKYMHFGNFSAWKYERDNVETWATAYQNMQQDHDEKVRKQYEQEQAEYMEQQRRHDAR